MNVTPDQLEHFRQRLLNIREELQQENSVDTGETVELDQSRVGRLSRMDALQGQQMALEAKRRRERRLLAVEGALRRIEQDDFGYCYVCGDPIEPKRLESDPTFTRCPECAAES
jgi:DnaK suppressor protein